MELNIHIWSLVTAYLLDRLFADPVWLPHPVVWYGKFIAWCDNKFNHGSRRFVKGMVITIVAVTGVYFAFRWLISMAFQMNQWLGWGIETLLVFFGLAGTTLIKEGKAVFGKLNEGLDAGRKQVARIVGRDTGRLTAHEVKTATLETLAENLSDGVVAPLFWLAVGGVPGMMTYKMINTLDSMIGYRNEKYLYFGRSAARLDDVANYQPARLTALLMSICSMKWRPWRFIFRYGRAHKSPNAGYPEAALAGILNVQFGGDHDYFGELVHKPVIGHNPRDLSDKDMNKTIMINRMAEAAMILLVTGCWLLLDNL
jgi:adenosylcobinamide-phosphate synthase